MKKYRIEIKQKGQPLNIWLDRYDEEIVEEIRRAFKDKKLALFGTEEVKEGNNGYTRSHQ